MDLPQISVLLPFFNAEKTLCRAIESILNQTFPDFELILVNNNSMDSSSDVALKFCKLDQRCKLIHEFNPGIVLALNQGITSSLGKYIARMDADDFSFSNRLERQYSFLERHTEYGVVSGTVEYIPHKNETDGFARYVQWSNSIKEHSEIYCKQFMESPIIHPTVMWRREILATYGVYENGDFPEDYQLWLRWLGSGVKFHKLQDPVIKWYDSNNRLTRTDDRYSDEAFFEVKAKHLARWLKSQNPHHPYVMVWGASKISRKRARVLENHGIIISAYIDISKKRQLNEHIIYYKNLPTYKEIFVLVYLKEESMRSKTVDFLRSSGFEEGKNFLLVS